MTALGLKVTKSLLSVSMINYPSEQACGCEVIVNDCSIGDGPASSSLNMVDLSSNFSFYINDHSKYQNIILVFGMISDRKYMQ